ncbi:single-stranded DNA-binding protein [Nocardia panacis]|nr:single-stranded DNA-binding protein [Nocardia panacis]
MTTTLDTTGTGFIIAEIELKFTPAGQAVANFPISFGRNVKDLAGEWEKRDTILVRATAWGLLAEFIAENFQAKAEIEVSGPIFEQSWTDKDGNERKSLAMRVRQASGPIQKREYSNSGSDAAKPSKRGNGKKASPWDSDDI